MQSYIFTWSNVSTPSSQVFSLSLPKVITILRLSIFHILAYTCTVHVCMCPQVIYIYGVGFWVLSFYKMVVYLLSACLFFNSVFFEIYLLMHIALVFSLTAV